METNNELWSIFNGIDDHRRDVTKLQNLNDILLIGIISVICEAETWGILKGTPVQKLIISVAFLPFLNGIPLHDTLHITIYQVKNKVRGLSKSDPVPLGYRKQTALVFRCGILRRRLSKKNGQLRTKLFDTKQNCPKPAQERKNRKTRFEGAKV